MKTLPSFKNQFLTSFFLVVIAAGLVNCDYFYSPGTAAYYGFCISALALAIISSYFYWTNIKKIAFKTPLLLLGIWCLYVVVHYFNTTATIYYTLYSIVIFFLLYTASQIFSREQFNFTLLFGGIAVLSFLESIICIAQYLGYLESQNELFKATGSWVNPNVTAMFLALCVPIHLFLFQSQYKKGVIIGFSALLLALVILKCRAAFIGTILALAVFYSLKYNFIAWVKNKKNSTTSKALLVLAILIIIPVSSHLYNAKKASADGRKFIWKLSAQMAIQKPLTGRGYGYFTKEYNLFQSNYIQNDKASPKELENAATVIVPHNEILQHAIEGGGIGLVLMALFFGSLLFSLKKYKKKSENPLNINTASNLKNDLFHLSHAGIIGFVAMAMVNTCFIVIPIMSVLIMYAAIVCSIQEPIALSSKFSFLKNNSKIALMTKTTSTLISVYVIYLLFGMAAADRQNRIAFLLKKEGKYEQALQIMHKLEPKLKGDSEYWKNYGNLYYLTHKYPEALKCLKKGKEITTSVELYLGSGACYEKLRQYPQAIEEYKQLTLLNPTKFNYRSRLMMAYINNKDSLMAVQTAYGILDLKPKIPSAKVMSYKKAAERILLTLDTNFRNRSAAKKTFLFNNQKSHFQFKNQ